MAIAIAIKLFSISAWASKLFSSLLFYIMFSFELQLLQLGYTKICVINFFKPLRQMFYIAVVASAVA